MSGFNGGLPAGALALCLSALSFLETGCATPQSSRPGAAELINRMENNRALLDPPPRHNKDGSTTSFASSPPPPYGLMKTDPASSPWIFSTMDEEQGLLEIGSPAVKEILDTVRDPQKHRDLRARLSIILGRIGDPSAGLPLLSILEAETECGLRDCFLTAAGLLRSKGLLKHLGSVRTRGPSEERLLLWVRGMSGCPNSMDSFADQVEKQIAAEELEDVTQGLPVPKLILSEDDFHLYLQAKDKPENESLDMDLWRAACHPSLRTVKILIDALGYHNPWVQHMSHYLLLRDVESGPYDLKSLPSGYDVMARKAYLTWRDWWEKNGTRVAWDASTSKYRLQGPQGKSP